MMLFTTSEADLLAAKGAMLRRHGTSTRDRPLKLARVAPSVRRLRLSLSSRPSEAEVTKAGQYCIELLRYVEPAHSSEWWPDDCSPGNMIIQRTSFQPSSPLKPDQRTLPFAPSIWKSLASPISHPPRR